MPSALKSKRNKGGEPRTAEPGGLTRRGLGRLAVGGGVFCLFRERAGAERIDRVRLLSVRYRSDPKRIASLLPPPLVPDLLPDIQVDYLSVVGRGLSPLGEGGEEEIGWFILRAAARYGRRRGMIALGLITDHEWGRVRAREFLGFPAKPGEVSLSVDGLSVRASCGLDGRTVQRLETTVGNRPAHPLAPRRSTGFGSFVYRYAPGVDASQAVIDPPVELWRVGAAAARPSEGDSDEGPATACDISQTKFTWGPAAAGDAAAALPVKEFVGAAYQELQGAEAVGWRNRESRRKQVLLAEVEPRRFAPWVFSRYDRPLGLATDRSPARRGKVFLDVKLSSAEMAAYRRREEDELGPMSLVEFRVSIDPERHAAVLPPGCEPGRGPLLRVMVLRAEGGDFSRRPFHEAWLFASCRVDRRPRWYALSHVVDEDGEALLGRERFGYPTLQGRIDVGISPEGFSFSGSRRGRLFVRGEGAFRGFSTGLSLSRINIVSLRARPFRPGTPSKAELIEQTFFFQGRRHYGNHRSLELSFPGGLGPAGMAAGTAPKASPWFALGPFEIVSAGAMEDAHMQRGPGRVLQGVSGFEPYYRERCDGVLPGEPLPEASVQPTFGEARDPRSQS